MTRGTGTPTFWTEEYSTPCTFQDEKVKNLLLPAVNRGDLRRLNYNKTILGQGSAPDPAVRELVTLSQTQESDEEGILPPHSPPLSYRDPRAPRSPSELVPPLFRPKLRLWVQHLHFRLIFFKSVINLLRYHVHKTDRQTDSQTETDNDDRTSKRRWLRWRVQKIQNTLTAYFDNCP